MFGLRERGGELRTLELASLKARDVQGHIAKNVKPGATIMTDEHVSYVGLSRSYNHHAVNHSAGEYVRHFTLHTNGIESIWALFKRQIIGTDHWLSQKHLGRYLEEMTWRFNLREMAEGARVNALLAQTAGRLTYKALTA